MGNTSASSIASFYTSNGVTRLNGSEFASGLDTQSLIKALTAKTQSKIDRQKQLEQKSEWKQSMYRDVEALMQSFSDSYFSFATDSSTNIMSSAFFDNSALTSSNSGVVTATGGAQDAGNVVINSISQLATVASMSSGYQVSNESITSTDALRNDWVQSAVGGKSFTINYGNKDYTFTLSNSIVIDSSKTTTQNLQTIADGINAQIAATDGLNGKMYFSVDSGTKLKLNMDTATETATIKASGSTSDDKAASTAFLSALGFANNSATSGGAVTGNAVTIDSTNTLNNVLFNQTIKTGSYLNIKVGSNTYNLSLSGFDLSSATTDETTATKIKDELNKQIDAISDLKGKGVSFSVSGKELSITGGTIAGASDNLLTGLGITQSGSTYTFNTNGVSKKNLTTSTLKDALDGASLTFKLDGATKIITFNDSELSQFYNSADTTNADRAHRIATYLQGKLDTAYGLGKITVGTDNNNTGDKLVFSTSDSTSILELNSSSASGVLGKDGALRIGAGETNRAETSKTLKDLANEFTNSLQPSYTKDGTNYYKLTINGKTFTFDDNTELNTVMNTINDDTDAGVNISYSQTTNQFRITSDDTGAQGKISVYDNGGNLAENLFGINYSSSYAAKSGNITQTSDGKITTGNVASTYNISINGSTNANITVPQNSSYNSMQDFANAIQTSINNNADLAGKVSVGVTSDGKQLTFNSTSPSGSSVTIKETSDSAGDVLALTTTGQSSLDISKTLAALDASSDIITTSDGGTNYSVTIGGVSKTYSSNTTFAQVLTDFSNVGYNGISAGKDLSMDVTLSGSSSKTTINRSTNSFTLDGVTMTISSEFNKNNADPTATIKFTPSNNVDDLYKKISDFVDAYNKIIDKANTYTSQEPYGLNSEAGTNTKYDPLTDDQKKEMTKDEITEWNDKAKQGLLQNDNALNLLLRDLGSAMEDTVSSVGMTLSDIGISTGAYDYTSGGKLTINETTLKSKLKSDPEKVSELFTNADGISSRVKSVITNNIGTYGNSGILVNIAGSNTLIGADNSQLALEITNYKTTIKNLQTQMQTEQDRWQTKFTNMETAVYKLSSQMNYLNSMSSGS
ncbi:MAG TPA: flagellar filament capping protein FliD [Caproicibacter sp.]|nr:flagellar filament capping protein FliD [Caproicibacter sp.]